MSDKKPFYITTTLPYVNDKPHMGHALEFVHADIVARYERLMGREVFFNTGTDEHGQKVSTKAKEEGRDVQEYADDYAARFKALKETLGLSWDAFIRTTDPGHVQAAQELWRRCDAVGDIDKRKYKGLYCVGDEAFVKESDLVNGYCPNHPNQKPIEIEEENYFFKLSAYQDQLLTYLAREDAILPGWRRGEAINFIKAGLEDISISRDKSRLSWGVAVPGDDTQVMYVWFDALTNYISTLGWPDDKAGTFKKFWDGGEVVQMAGKDQVRFQSILWQAMLMSAEIKNTDKVVYHGFITSEGQKMSKSIGNVIDPLEVAKEYGTDALRYFLVRHISSFEDSDFTMERFKEAYNADLANGLGNLVARIMQLAQTHLEQPVKVEWRALPEEFVAALENYEINKAADVAWELIRLLDQKITETAPFKIIKEAPERGKALIADLVRDLAFIDEMLEPLIPQTSKMIIDAIMANKKPETLFPRKE